ncbi:MAG TPA: transketolase [Acidimicrobiia bacterium]|nr:transketolase [Acidimicrobiia bacterium]
MANELEAKAINVIRGLAMDAVQKANSGHPGTPMALAPLAHVLNTRIMRYDAAEPGWPDRDRFILSAGHASMLLYAMLYLTGFGLTLDDVKQFRQWGSRTAGHPEHGHAPGIEVTTGPLGQGFANGVGMAIAEANLRARFGADVCDHRIFAICSDGDLEEGVSHEAASLAGHLQLGRLVYVYDDNHISIDGKTEISLSDDAGKRFEAYGWHVVRAGEVAEDLDALEAALREGIGEEGRPTLVILRSHIGYPSPNFTDSPKAHGEPLGADEVARVKEILGMPADQTFWVPDDVLDFYRRAGRRGAAERDAWAGRLERFRSQEPELAEEFELCLAGRGRAGWEQKLPTWQPGEQVATRAACTDALNAVAGLVPALLGGGADLTGNTGTKLSGFGVFSPEDRKGRQIYFGVREHGMGSAMNGMALHGGVLPFGGTFLIFSDYMRASVRLAALEQARTCFVWSHDSIGLGEDGPTHQPVEQLASLRAIPSLRVIRPADANETAQCWRIHVNAEGPSAFILSRQKLPVLEGTAERAEAGVARGAYVLVDEPGDLQLVLVATGSEVSICVEAQKTLAGQGISARVVSMPCWELFQLLSEDEQAAVLPPGMPTLAVEAAATLGWERWADDVIGLDRFGASAPGATALEKLGFTPACVVDRARALLAAPGPRRRTPPGFGGATAERREQP